MYLYIILFNYPPADILVTVAFRAYVLTVIKKTLKKYSTFNTSRPCKVPIRLNKNSPLLYKYYLISFHAEIKYCSWCDVTLRRERNLSKTPMQTKCSEKTCNKCQKNNEITRVMDSTRYLFEFRKTVV